MTNIVEVEKLAFSLPDRERALLAAHLLESLPAVATMADDDEGGAEAWRRDAELTARPGMALSLTQLADKVRAQRS